MRIFSKYFWEDLYYDTKWGVKNLITYFKVVWGSRHWDFNGTPMVMLKFNLEQLLPSIENGYEVDESRLEKVKNIKRCIELLDRLLKDEYIDELGGYHLTKHPFEFVPIDDSPESDLKCYTIKEFRTETEIEEDTLKTRLSVKLQENDWIELWTIIQRDSQGWWS